MGSSNASGGKFYTNVLHADIPFDDGQGGIGAIGVDVQFNYTFNFAAQLKKKIIDKLNGYVGLSLLASWVRLTSDLSIPGVGITGGSEYKNCILFGVSPQLGLIYNISDKMFATFDGHIAIYQKEGLDQIITGVISLNSKIQPIVAGVGLGLGWKL